MNSATCDNCGGEIRYEKNARKVKKADGRVVFLHHTAEQCYPGRVIVDRAQDPLDYLDPGWRISD